MSNQMIKLFKFLFFFATTTFIYAVSPASQKIETILPLTNTCFVVVINNQAEIIAEINRLSNNELQTMVDRWESSMPAGNPPDWHAYKARAKIRNKYLHQARENLKERDFAQKGFYSLKSKGKTSPSVLEVNITYVGVDASDLPGDHQFKYGIYAYLELDSPMKNGQTYTIYAPNKLERTFNYNEKMQISRAIKVNQVGYLPNQAGKFAYLGAYIYGKGPLDCSKAKKFHIIDESTGKSVYEGEISIREKDPRWHNENAKRINGEDIYQMNLDDFNESGHFHIYIPGVGRSWSFIQSAEVYGEAYYIAARGFYHQRAVMEYQEPYTFWKRDLAHTEDVYECDLIPFGFGAKFDAPKTSNLRFDVIGGSISSRFPLKKEECHDGQRT